VPNVPQDHERVEELLAGYVLRALSGPDAEEADRLLSEHVPTCLLCRDALDGLRSVAGELALSPWPMQPPDVVLPRIRRALAEEPARVRRRPGLMLAAAAGFVAVLGMAGLTVSLGVRTSHVQTQNVLMREALGVASRPDASQVALRGDTQPQTPLTEISAPGLERMYLIGTGVPAPTQGRAYQLWLGSGGRFAPIGEMFVPEDGLVILALTVDPSRYDEILITEEPAGTTPAEPTGPRRWSAPL